jgi:hypothetical protein
MIGLLRQLLWNTLLLLAVAEAGMHRPLNLEAAVVVQAATLHLRSLPLLGQPTP